jgi:hypothetical protein
MRYEKPELALVNDVAAIVLGGFGPAANDNIIQIPFDYVPGVGGLDD